MAASPIYFTTPGNVTNQLTAANVALDGTSAVSLLVGTAAGRRVSRARLSTAILTAPAAQKITFFLSTDNGVTKRFLCDVLLLAASAPAAGVRSTYVEVPELVGLVMQSTNTILYAASWIAQATNVALEYNDA